jgi:beta-lactamase regulating signal transducer with metallopeptidase domain/Tfp pilus assembly protein PilF
MSQVSLWNQVLQTSAAIADLAAAWLVQSTLVIALGWLGGRALRRHGAALECAVYRVTLAAALVCPLVSALLAQTGIMPAIAIVPGIADRLNAAQPRVDQVPTQRVEADGSYPAIDEVTPRPASPRPQGRGSVPRAPAIIPPTPFRTWPIETRVAVAAMGISLVWLAGSSLLLARLVVAHFQVAAICRTAVRCGDEIQGLCRQLSRQLAVTPPEVLQTPFVASPCLVGILRPVILLPEDLPGEVTGAALVHELAHLRRGDAAWNLARRVAVAVLFFQPLLWRLSRLLETAAEDVCDDYAVSHQVDRRAYADMLVDLAKHSLVAANSAVVPLVTPRSLLAKRIDRILDGTRRLSLRAGSWALGPIVAVALAATVVAGTFRPAVEGRSLALPPAPPARSAAEPGKFDPATHVYHVGDRIVAIHQAPIVHDGTRVDRAFMGWVYAVDKVEGTRIWVSAKTPGWIDSRHVIPFERAHAYFSDMIDRQQNVWYARRARATILMYDGQFETAIQDFSELLRQNPKDHTVWNDRGRAWLHAGNYDQAITNFSEAIRLQRVTPVYFNNRASAWHYKGDYAQAIRDWKSALTLRPKFYWPEKSLANLYATCPDPAFRNGTEALKHAIVACEFGSWQSADDIENLAAAHAELGNFDEAIRWQTKANDLRRTANDRADGVARLALLKQRQPIRIEPAQTPLEP